MNDLNEEYVQAVYDYQYQHKNGHLVQMFKDEQFLLVARTNDRWWQVIRHGERQPFFAPCQYLTLIESNTLSLSDLSDSHLSATSFSHSSHANLTASNSSLSDILEDDKKCTSVVLTQCSTIVTSSLVTSSFVTSSLVTSSFVTSSLVTHAKPLNQTTTTTNRYKRSISLDNTAQHVKSKPVTSTFDGYRSKAVPTKIPETMPSSKVDDLSQAMSSLSIDLGRPSRFSRLSSVRVRASDRDLAGCRHETRHTGTSHHQPHKLSRSVEDLNSIGIVDRNYSQHPPTPHILETPIKTLFAGWGQYLHGDRKYYYNVDTCVSSWKPPRRSVLDVQKSSNSVSAANSYSLGMACVSSKRKFNDPISKSQLEPVLEHSAATVVSTATVHTTPTIRPHTGVGAVSTAAAHTASIDVLMRAATLAEAPLPAQPSPSTFVSTVSVSRHPIPAASTALSQQQKQQKLTLSLSTSAIRHPGAGNMRSFRRLAPNRGPQAAQQSKLYVIPPTPPVHSAPIRDSHVTSHDAFSPASTSPANRKLRSSISMISTPVCSVTSEVEDTTDSSAMSVYPTNPTAPEMFLSQSFIEPVLHQGTLNYALVCDHTGKRLRKIWLVCNALLTKCSLILYKLGRCLKNNNRLNRPEPELCVSLIEATISWESCRSSRRNVFQISCLHGLQLLLQDQSSTTSQVWYDAIRRTICRCVRGKDRIRLMTNDASSNQISMGGVTSMLSDVDLSQRKLSRSRSARVNMNSSKCSLSPRSLLYTAPASQQPIVHSLRNRLMKLFRSRPSVESLIKRGIIRDEPVFGCLLGELCLREKSTVPRLIQLCIQIIEANEEYMKTDGLYRVSGNLSEVQRIRFHVNQERYGVLHAETDVHVLTGTLKLFLREMKQPLIPSCLLRECMSVVDMAHRSSQVHALRRFRRQMAPVNSSTLAALLAHLHTVISYARFNRMHAHNLSIVFGPSLMWSERKHGCVVGGGATDRAQSPATSSNLAIDFMRQNQFVEILLENYAVVFATP